MSDTPSDAELVRAAQRDPAAFDALYRRYLTPVYRYVRARVGSTADAEDVTAATFLAALRALPRYEERGRFPGWLFTIARRKVMAHHSAAGRAPLPLTEPGPAAAAELDRARRHEVLAALAQLTDDRQEALRLRFFGGLRVREVAEVMGRSESAAKMLLHRGLHQLRALLADPPEGADDG